MVNRYIEEPLQLLGVQVNGKNPVRARGGNQIGDEFGRNRNSAFVFAVLAGITKIWNNCGNSFCARPFETIEIYEQLDEVFIDGAARRLKYETVPAPHIVFDADDFFAVREFFYLGSAHRQLKIFTHFFCQRLIGAARKYLYVII